MEESKYYLITHTDENQYLFTTPDNCTISIEDPFEWAIPQHKIIKGKMTSSSCGHEECCPYTAIYIKEVKEITEQEYINLGLKAKNIGR